MCAVRICLLRRSLTTAYLLLLLATTSLAHDLPRAVPEAEGVSSEKLRKLSQFTQSLVDQQKIAGGVTMMARHGKVVHFEAFGWADREEGKQMQTDCIFRIASMSKPITCVAVMTLYDEGKVDLDEPVSDYIPEFGNPNVLVDAVTMKTRPAEREITIRDLLTHTSGLAYEFNSETMRPNYSKHKIPSSTFTTDLTLKASMKKLGNLPLLFSPGERFQYGLSIDVLGRVIEVASGESLEDYIRQEVCLPIGMEDTYFTVPPEKRDRVPALYYPVDGLFAPQEKGITKLEPGENEQLSWITISSDFHTQRNKYHSGGGGLCSTPEDYMRFCQMILNGGKLGDARILKEETVEMMTTNQIPYLMQSGLCGFGFILIPDEKERPQHLRGTISAGGGWSTWFRMSVKNDWIHISMFQVLWTKETRKRFEEMDRLAADAIQ